MPKYYTFSKTLSSHRNKPNLVLVLAGALSLEEIQEEGSTADGLRPGPSHQSAFAGERVGDISFQGDR